MFSELDPERRSHLVRRIGGLAQAFVTTTTLDDLDPALVRAATAWRVEPGRLEVRRHDPAAPACAGVGACCRTRSPRLGIADAARRGARDGVLGAVVAELVPGGRGRLASCSRSGRPSSW